MVSMNIDPVTKGPMAGPEQLVPVTAAPATGEPGVNPEKPAYLISIPSLDEFFDRLPTVISKASYGEMWGVILKGSDDIPTANVLIKFLRANDGNLDAAEDQLLKALDWRRNTNPLGLVEFGRHSASKYGGLGYLTSYLHDSRPLVFTWNIYGAVKDVKATFGDLDE